jgi:hypothetical protein
MAGHKTSGQQFGKQVMEFPYTSAAQNPKGSVTSLQRIRGYISVMATLIFVIFNLGNNVLLKVIEEIIFFGGMFISHGRTSIKKFLVLMKRAATILKNAISRNAFP